MVKNRAILDSNIFFACYFSNDSLHKRSILLMETLKLKEYELFIPYSVIQEVTTLIVYRFGKDQADHFLNGLKGKDDIVFIDNDLKGELDFYLKFHQKISFTDIGLIYLAQKYNAMLFTFDKQLLNLYKNHR